MDAETPAPEQYVTFAEVIKATGLSERKITRRVITDGIKVFVDPHDRRRRLIRSDDLPKLTELREAPRRETSAA